MFAFIVFLIVGIVLIAFSCEKYSAEINDYVHDPGKEFTDRISKLSETDPQRANTELLSAICELLAQNLRMQKIIAENTQRTADVATLALRFSGIICIFYGILCLF